MPRITVCKDCQERHTACHDHCERYLAERDAGNKARDKYVKENQGNTDMTRMRTEKKYKRIKRFKKTW